MIKRLPVLCCSIVALAVLVTHYAPARAQSSGITYPPETEVVRGVIQIVGTAQHPEFWKYELAAAPYQTQNWFNIAVNESPVQNGVLGTWDTQKNSDCS